MRLYRDIDERLRARREVTESGCWLWTGKKNVAGYGLTTSEGRTVLVHRLAYGRHVGPIPDGLQLDHLCRVRHCINPDHLEPVTNRENTMRSPLTLASVNAAKTHCPQGHEYTPENTLVWRNAKRSCTERRCRTCRSEYARQWRAARMAAS